MSRLSNGSGERTLRDWITSRQPSVPEAFADYMQPAEPDAAAGVDALVAEAGRALGLALQGDARERRGAFDLLAADGFATWACEAALEQPDADKRLNDILLALLQ